MTFKRIGTIAARLIADPVKLQAAADEAPQRDGAPEAKRSDVPFMGSMGGGGPSVGRTDSPPIARAFGEEPLASKLNGKGAEPAGPAKCVGRTPKKGNSIMRVVKEPSPRERPVLRLVSNRGEPTHAAHEGVLTPTRRVGSPMLLIVGGRDHAALSKRSLSTVGCLSTRSREGVDHDRPLTSPI
jgi:hypothetical protein